ncbi:MAG: hypothetical protein IJ189_14420 [Clostridia bacterium]|nr:hypothetical protein [Clostridia bacterium]
MEALFPILIMWLIVGLIGKIKKAPAQPPSRQARPQAGPAPKPAQIVKPAAPAAPQVHQRMMDPEPMHHPEPFETHMHEPVMGEEGTGTEGIDCCHDFMLSSPEEEIAPSLPFAEDAEDKRAKALLQGVIFSEILGRRPQRRYGGRHA